MQVWYILGVGKVSCLERCPQFGGILTERGSTVYQRVLNKDVNSIVLLCAER